jgi:hypothetical protein
VAFLGGLLQCVGAEIYVDDCLIGMACPSIACGAECRLRVEPNTNRLTIV